jgi:DnaJ-class molecular chaperone
MTDETLGGRHMAKCPDCDGEKWFDKDVGDGKCSECHGSGVNPNPADIVLGDEECPVCGTSGICQTCHGEGEV